MKNIDSQLGLSANKAYKEAVNKGYEGSFGEFLGFVKGSDFYEIGGKDDAETQIAYRNYRDAQMAKGKDSLTFSEWYEKEKKKEQALQIGKTALETGKGLLDTLGGIFGKKPEEISDIPAPPLAAEPKKFLGMPIGVAITVGVVLAAGATFLIVRQVRKNK